MDATVLKLGEVRDGTLCYSSHFFVGIRMRQVQRSSATNLTFLSSLDEIG